MHGVHRVGQSSTTELDFDLAVHMAIDLINHVFPNHVTLYTQMYPVSNAALELRVPPSDAAAGSAASSGDGAVAAAAPGASAVSASSAASAAPAASAASKASAASATSAASAASATSAGASAAARASAPAPPKARAALQIGRHALVRVLVYGRPEIAYFSAGALVSVQTCACAQVFDRPLSPSSPLSLCSNLPTLALLFRVVSPLLLCCAAHYGQKITPIVYEGGSSSTSTSTSIASTSTLPLRMQPHDLFKDITPLLDEKYDKADQRELGALKASIETVRPPPVLPLRTATGCCRFGLSHPPPPPLAGRVRAARSSPSSGEAPALPHD